MIKIILCASLILVIGFFCSYSLTHIKKPEARLLGIKKGKVDRLRFLGATKIELINNNDSLWQIVGYEFDLNCGGDITLKYYRGATIPREILVMLKDCNANQPIVDFVNIKAKNNKTNVEIILNELEFTVPK